MAALIDSFIEHSILKQGNADPAPAAHLKIRLPGVSSRNCIG